MRTDIQNEYLLNLITPILQTLERLFAERLKEAFALDITTGEIGWITIPHPGSYTEKTSWVWKDRDIYQVSDRPEISFLIDALNEILKNFRYSVRHSYALDWYSFGLKEPELPGDLRQGILLKVKRRNE